MEVYLQPEEFLGLSPGPFRSSLAAGKGPGPALLIFQPCQRPATIWDRTKFV